ncbi:MULTISPECIES: LysR family transcriptional regulator [Bacillus]|uniref:LysR family transcriptional regulator n=1 Tax=Bacillus TaxID=1386 RepID=UPI0004D50560|nr:MULTISPECIES: LysR family transcriptional regulator [Bacillus]KEP30188.1 transcriptional regulator [Bacillus safensis]KRE14164.1 transcriptional regulator [Bacillus sp. Root920]MBZ9521995.1 LysR family transcriptional regulator [Bacillus safensis]MCM3368691.1 LysR family transcriptional regulator [Bacillus safensis]MCY7567278.1 LysR family transcriptional regulator [Bacillus safensis]
MDLKELKAFQAIIQEGTFSKAAQKLNYAQSTITNQIKRLEKELGFQLFVRGWEAELTPSGQLFAKEIDQLILHWHFVLEQSQKLQKEEIGTLNIGVIEPIAATILPSVLQTFRRQKPNITCHFIIGNTDFLHKLLLKGELDFAISGEPVMNTLPFEELYKEEMSFIIAKQQADQVGPISLIKDLYEQPLIIGGESCLYHIKLQKELSRINVEPFTYTISQISAIPSFLKKFPSVGVVLSSTLLSDEFVKVPIEMEDPFIPIGILTHKERHLSLENTKQLLLDLFRQEVEQFTCS